jgi:hypothetical protein
VALKNADVNVRVVGDQNVGVKRPAYLLLDDREGWRVGYVVVGQSVDTCGEVPDRPLGRLTSSSTASASLIRARGWW